MVKAEICNKQSENKFDIHAKQIFKEFNAHIKNQKLYGCQPKKILYFNKYHCFAYRFCNRVIDLFLLDRYANLGKIQNINNAAEVSKMKITLEKRKNHPIKVTYKPLVTKKESQFMLSNEEIIKFEKPFKLLDKSIRLTNQTASKIERVKKGLFRVVRVTVESFKNNDELINEYKKGIVKKHRSTIYLMIKVASNDVLQKHKKSLPSSYQTLYECLKLLNEVEQEQFQELINVEKLTSKSSKADVTKLRKEYKANFIDTKSAVQTRYSAYSDVLVATQSLSHNEKLNMLEYLIESLTDEERHGLISMYLDEAA